MFLGNRMPVGRRWRCRPRAGGSTKSQGHGEGGGERRQGCSLPGVVFFVFREMQAWEPAADGLVEAEVVHVVVGGEAEAAAHLLDVVVELGWLGLVGGVYGLGGQPVHLVVAEWVGCGVGAHGSIAGGIEAGGAVAGHGIAVPEGALHNAFVEHGAYHFEGVEGFLQRFGGESVHKVGVYHDAGIAEVAAYLDGLVYGDPFVDEL